MSHECPINPNPMSSDYHITILKCLLDQHHLCHNWTPVPPQNLTYILLIFLLLFSANLTCRGSCNSKFHVYVLLLMPYQRVDPNLWPYLTLCNMLFYFIGKHSWHHTNTQAAEPHPVSVNDWPLNVFTVILIISKQSPPPNNGVPCYVENGPT
jgi:hypothetical protein